jgi:hypothetical protein
MGAQVLNGCCRFWVEKTVGIRRLGYLGGKNQVRMRLMPNQHRISTRNESVFEDFCLLLCIFVLSTKLFYFAPCDTGTRLVAAVNLQILGNPPPRHEAWKPCRALVFPNTSSMPTDHPHIDA